MQRLWIAQISWDDPLPSDIDEEWLRFYNAIGWLTEIKVPRHIGCSPQSHYLLCGFCDASVKGYAAVVYLRVRSPSQKISVFLLGTKTKLAPMKDITIPCLELCAAVLLAQWMARLKRVLEAHIQISEVFAWSDSTIVLAWLNNPHTSFKTFVSNRVHQIQKTFPQGCQWSHISSDDNPADCASRGLRPSELPACTLYWSGPSFLGQPIDTWEFKSPEVPLDQLPEANTVSLMITVDKPQDEWTRRFSSLTHMLRVISRMQRFVDKCRHLEIVYGFITKRELDLALVVVSKNAQECHLFQLVRALQRAEVVSPKSIARLCPFIDSYGVIRVGGRLRNANLSYERKHPILIPKTSHLAVLVARHWHQFGCHAQSRLLMALLQHRYWIIGARSVVHRTLRSCSTCVKLTAANPQPMMADLPASRVQVCRTFSSVGIDYAGPLTMKEGRLRKTLEYKVYIVLFICMSTKAVHLELVLDLSTDAFLAALDRFVARRGLPTSIYSDCGTNFVGAARHLRKLVNDPAHQDQLTSHISCTWHFNPPSAPHFGGIWEAAVKSANSLLIRSMGSQVLTLEEFSTLLCRVEAALNSRPLNPISYDPNDLDCLTPGHFIIGQPLLMVPEVEVTFERPNLRNRWKLVQQLGQSFWRRWSAEYLNSLQARGQWTDS